MEEKLIELSRVLCDLTGITVRCVAGSRRIAFFSQTSYPEWLIDPMLERLEVHEHIKSSTINSIAVESSHFGVLRFRDYHFVIGPVLDADVPDDQLRAGALSHVRWAASRNAANLSSLPTEDEMVREAMKILHECRIMSPHALILLMANVRTLLHFSDDPALPADPGQPEVSTHSEVAFYHYLDGDLTLVHQDIDTFFRELISQGNVNGFRDWSNYSTFRDISIPLVDDPITNSRYNFILLASLLSASAIQGGLSRFSTLELLTHYIRRTETAENEEDIHRLLQSLGEAFATELLLSNETGENPSLASRASQYVRENLYSSLKIGDIADALYVSRSHLSQVYHQETGQTLLEYIRQKKIDEACYLMTSSENSIAQISAMLGFSSQSYFTKVFRKYKGMTPREYQLKYR